MFSATTDLHRVVTAADSERAAASLRPHGGETAPIENRATRAEAQGSAYLIQRHASGADR
jgi:hypothetical protein